MMIAISLGLVVLGGVLSVMLPTVNTFKTASAISSLQDIEQIAHDRIGRNIRQSALMACGGELVQSGVPSNQTTNVNWAFSNFNTPFEVYSAADNTSHASINAERLKQNSIGSLGGSDTGYVGDFFLALAPNGFSARIQNETNNSGNSLDIAPNTINKGDLFLVHDCEQPVIFRATSNNNATTITYDKSGSNYNSNTDFPRYTMVSLYEPTLFYLGDLSNDDRTALYARTISKSLDTNTGTTLETTDQAILTGIVNMRIVKSTDEKTVRVTLMVESDQDSPNHGQTSLKFPVSSGAGMADCIDSNNSDAGLSTNDIKSACPLFVDYSNRLHKVIHFVFALPKQTAISY